MSEANLRARMQPSPRSRHRCCRGIYHLPPLFLAALLVWAYTVALVDVTALWHYRAQGRSGFSLAMGVRAARVGRG